MRRKAHHKLWTFILMLLLCGASLAPVARVARADATPTDPLPGSPPGDPQAGDPDVPGNGRGMPKPGSTRGAGGQTIGVMAPQRAPLSIWLRLRMAFAVMYRTLFRF